MKNKGFTLVEMLAVIALLAIIGTITAVSVKNINTITNAITMVYCFNVDFSFMPLPP